MYSMINIINTAVAYEHIHVLHMKVVKRVDPKSSCHKEKICFLFFCIYMR